MELKQVEQAYTMLRGLYYKAEEGLQDDDELATICSEYIAIKEALDDLKARLEYEEDKA